MPEKKLAIPVQLISELSLQTVLPFKKWLRDEKVDHVVVNELPSACNSKASLILNTLFSVLTWTPSVTALTIDCTGLNKLDFGIWSNTTLKKFALLHCVDTSLVNDLHRALPLLKSIEELSLSGAPSLCSLLATIALYLNLKKLSVGVDVDENTAQPGLMQAEWYKLFMYRESALEDLTLSGIRVNHSVIENIFRHEIKSFKKLSFKHCQLTIDALINLKKEAEVVNERVQVSVEKCKRGNRDITSLENAICEYTEEQQRVFALLFSQQLSIGPNNSILVSREVKGSKITSP